MEGERFEHALEERGLVEAGDPGAEGDGLYDRYLAALVLLVGVIIAFAFTGDGDAGRLLSVSLEGAALLVILRSSRVSNRVIVPVAVFVAVVVAACVVAAILADGLGRRGPLVVGALLAFLGPPVIIRRILTHHRIDLTTVAGALCVYLLAGLFFAYVYWIIGDLDPPFFVQPASNPGVDYIYFSFTTLATLGYGDFTARGDLGRMLSVTEAILGQLYLVSAVALLVGNLGRTRLETSVPPRAPKPPRPRLPQTRKRAKPEH